MNEQVQDQSSNSALDTIKLVLAVALLIAGIVAYYFYGDNAGWQRWSMMLGGLVLGVVVFFTSDTGRRFWTFVLESRIELRKVVWPERQETLRMTMVVIAFVSVAGLFFWLLDVLLAYLTGKLTGTGV
jgi:preprotein translocase subunit SecE